MIYLFIHQNFPGQYKHLAQHLSSNPENDVYFITQSKDRWLAGVTKLVYESDAAPESGNPFLTEMDICIKRALAVLQICQSLVRKNIRPDIIIGHNGWGETLFVKDIFPDVPLLSYFEFFYHPIGIDVGFNANAPATLASDCRIRIKNTVNLLGLEAADWGNTPTYWQHSLYPPEQRKRISVLHEGIDTTVAAPDPKASITLKRHGIVLSRQDEVITYVARNLEPYRGFPEFMRAAALLLQRRPRTHVIVVGGDGVSYGDPAPEGKSYRQLLLDELGDSIDPTRLHFVGSLSYSDYLSVLKISSAHIYLTYPFVLSWSFLEAMACACPIIGSATPPVLEVLQAEQNGVIADFFSPADIACQAERLLDDTTLANSLRRNARKTILDRFELSNSLKSWEILLGALIAGENPTPNANC